MTLNKSSKIVRLSTPYSNSMILFWNAKTHAFSSFLINTSELKMIYFNCHNIEDLIDKD